MRKDKKKKDIDKYLNNSVVQQEHNRCQIPHNSRVPEQVLANVAHIAHLGMPQAKPPVSR